MSTENISRDDCFAYQKLSLKLFGFSTNQNIFYKIYCISFLVFTTIYIFAALLEIFKSEKDFEELSSSLFFEISIIAALMCVYMLYLKRHEFQNLFEAMELLGNLVHCTNDNSKILFLKRCEESIKKQSFIGFLGWCFVNFSQILTSVLLSLNKEEWLLPYGNGPNINNNINFVAHIIVFPIINFLAVVEFVIYANMLTLTSNHCELLQNWLITIMDDKNSTEEVEGNQIANAKSQNYVATKLIDWKSFQAKLRIIVPYHVCIIDVANQIENAFTYIILVLFGGITISFAFLTFHVMTVYFDYPTLIKDLAILAVGNLIIILISFRGEQVITESGKILQICYDLDFVGADLRIRKALLLIMIRAQKPITPTIGKLKVLNFTTMVAIFKTIYTYYTIVRNVNNQKVI